MYIVNKEYIEKRNAIPSFCELFGITAFLIGDEAVICGLFEWLSIYLLLSNFPRNTSFGMSSLDLLPGQHLPSHTHAASYLCLISKCS